MGMLRCLRFVALLVLWGAGLAHAGVAPQPVTALAASQAPAVIAECGAQAPGLAVDAGCATSPHAESGFDLPELQAPPSASQPSGTARRVHSRGSHGPPPGPHLTGIHRPPDDHLRLG